MLCKEDSEESNWEDEDGSGKLEHAGVGILIVRVCWGGGGGGGLHKEDSEESNWEDENGSGKLEHAGVGILIVRVFWRGGGGGFAKRTVRSPTGKMRMDLISWNMLVVWGF